MAEKILVVEDEPSLQETLVYNLVKQGYLVEAAGEGHQAIEKARHFSPDLIILDIMLPGLDGFEICKILRKDMTAPILMLTARDDEIDRVVGLEVGADDYLTKPFSMRELIARVKAQLRRTELIRMEMARIGTTRKDKLGDIFVFGNLVINQDRREVALADTVLSLKPQEYNLLLFFAEHQGRMLSREFILERVWGWEFVGDSRTVDVHVRWLRQKIEKDPARPERIITVRGGGYRFEG
jgi:DNA-binding response OmpR family regulator